MTADDIIAAARACCGTPFRHQGRAPGVGLDCAGLYVAVATALGVPVDDCDAYGRHPAMGLLEAYAERQPGLVRSAEIVPGSLVLMRFGGPPRHVGIVGQDTLIHAWTNVGKVTEHRLSDEWRRRISAVYHFKDVA